jgi:predicted N-acyltransferase
VSKDAWDACANPSGNPFLSYDFLHALEASGSVATEQGWMPQHLLLYDPDDDQRLLGAVPLYLKGHSYGEYVFDQGVSVSL